MKYYLYNYNLFIILLFCLILLFSIYSEIKLKFIYNKYINKKNNKKLTGLDILNDIKKRRNINNINFSTTGGILSDYYDSKKKVIFLSDNIRKNASIASVAIASHEMGHAIQDEAKNLFLYFRNIASPVFKFSSQASIPLLFIGIILNNINLFLFGIFLYLFVAFFYIITVPVEINASKIAIELIKEGNYLNKKELIEAKKILSVAALTYIAAMVSVTFQLMRFFLIFLWNKE